MAETSAEDKQRIERIGKIIGLYPDFPKQGVLFRDIFPLFAQPALVEDCVQVFVNHLKKSSFTVDVIVGLESRGFLLAPMLAVAMKVPFVPIRKPGKLPGEVKTLEYKLEYGTDKFEIQVASIKPAANCVLFDDLLATGGSLKAAIELIKMCHAKVVECDVIIELFTLKGREALSAPVFPLIQYV